MRACLDADVHKIDISYLHKLLLLSANHGLKMRMENSKATRGLTPTLEREGVPGLGWSISCKRFERSGRHIQITYSSSKECDASVIDNVADTEKPVTGPEPVFGLHQTPKILVAAREKQRLAARCPNFLG